MSFPFVLLSKAFVLNEEVSKEEEEELQKEEDEELQEVSG